MIHFNNTSEQMFGRYIFPKYVIDTRIIKIKLREPRKQRLEYHGNYGNIHKSESLLSDSWPKKNFNNTCKVSELNSQNINL